MRIFLGLSDADLGATRSGDRLAQGHGQIVLAEEHVHIPVGGVVLRHGDIVQLQRLHAELGEGGLGERLGDLPAAVGSEVEADHYVTIGDGGYRRTGFIRHRMGPDEFIRNAFRIASVEGLQRVSNRGAAPMDQQVIGQLHALPPLVPVHGIVPADHAGYPGRLPLHRCEEALHVAPAAAWVGVPPIGEGVHEDLRQAAPGRHAAEGLQVGAHGMDAPIGNQADQVEPPATRAEEGFLQDRRTLQAAVRNGLVDAHQVLVHHAAGPDVEVPYLAVAHLPRRQPDMLSVGKQGGVRGFSHQAVDERGMGGGNGIAGIARTQPPAIHDDEDCLLLGHQSAIGNDAVKIAPWG